MIPAVARAARCRERLAVEAADGPATYGELLAAARSVAHGLLSAAGAEDLGGRRVAFLTAPSRAWVTILWGIWRTGGVAVPLSPLHPEPELEHAVSDCAATVLVASPEHRERLAPIAGRRSLPLSAPGDLAGDAEGRPLPDVAPDRGALIVYTSGTAGRPKGVLHTHASLAAQMASLERAWEWTATDRILSVLPLHHVHGIVNVVGCALWTGAACELSPRFVEEAVWDRLASGEVTLFMAVPTIYARLICAWEAAPALRQGAWSRGARRLRLMVSGSAPLPAAVLDRWQAITGHRLLERYGMTETGMILSNPLHGERVAGSVGTPLPGVDVRLIGEDGEPAPAEGPGEVVVRSPGLFREYWGQPEATGRALRDGWFATGDLAVVERGRYRLLGRLSADILKTGGYKVSALEIEEALRGHPAIADCAVVGVPDPEWGERVAAAVVAAGGADIDGEALRAWAQERLAPYKAPSLVRSVADLPRNALGKVDKAAVKRLFG